MSLTNQHLSDKVEHIKELQKPQIFEIVTHVSQAGDDERSKEKKARISKMEFLMKEMEGLLKLDGKVFSS